MNQTNKKDGIMNKDELDIESDDELTEEQKVLMKRFRAVAADESAKHKKIQEGLKPKPRSRAQRINEWWNSMSDEQRIERTREYPTIENPFKRD